MTNSKRYESGSAPDRADLRLSRESRADRAARQRLHERLLDERMWREANSCAKKRCYVTYEQARAVARHREQSTGQPLFIYKCDFCGGWHLTHQSDQQRYGREAGRAAEARIAREAAERAASAGPIARFGVGDLVVDEASDTPCVVSAVGEMDGEPAYELSSADGCSELGWVRESDVREA